MRPAARSPSRPSDDPRTPVVNDPTRDVVGVYPLLVARKTVAIAGDDNGNGIVDPGDVAPLHHHVSNLGRAAATGAA